MGFTIWELSNEWQKQLSVKLKEIDLTHVQYLILKAVYELEVNHEEKTQVKISNQARTNIMMTSKVIRSLEDKNFLDRYNHAGDKRAFRVTISKKGKKALRKAINIIEEFEKEFFNSLEKKKKIQKTLTKLIDEKKKA